MDSDSTAWVLFLRWFAMFPVKHKRCFCSLPLKAYSLDVEKALDITNW